MIKLTALSIVASLVLICGAAARAHAGEEELNAFYSTATETKSMATESKNQAPRAPASADQPWPEDLGKDFIVTAPDRSPASVRPAPVAKKKPAPKVARAASPASRRSRLPAAVSDGFELRVRYNKLTTMFWVVKRDDRFDLMFANSGGSRSSRSLDETSFKALQAATSRLPASETNITKCPEASMQLHVLGANKSERTTTLCVSDKTKAAEELRNLSQSLAAYVR